MSVDYYFKNRLSKNSKELQQIMHKPWLADHIKNGHGPLCAAYPQEYTSEGDIFFYAGYVMDLNSIQTIH